MKRLKLFILMFAFLFLFCVTGNVLAGNLIASKYSDRYHTASCKIAQNIPAQDALSFASDEEASQAGYDPCKKCHPSTVSRNFN